MHACRSTLEDPTPVDEALRLAREVADALEYAHQHGVVHRDIKPENILLHGGHAVVADFGIALAASRSEGGTRMTETGMSLGTPHYMSPEQAMGDREITPRADIYALGCVLYEMLTGEPPFVGASAQAIIGRVLTEDPRSLTAQRKTIPPNVDDAVRVALAKLPADRFASAKEFSEALVKPGFTAAATVATSRTATGPRRARSRTDLVLFTAPWVIALALAGLYVRDRQRAPAPPAPLARFSVNLTPQVETNYPWQAMALSPDGSRLVYVGIPNTGQQLFVRRLDADGAMPVPGTAGATNPFFSQDGTQIAFVSGNKLMKVAVDGGAPISVTALANTFWGGTWHGDSIVFADERGLHVVPAAGGEPTLIESRPDAQNKTLRWPEYLPDGRRLLLSENDGSVDRLAVFTMADRSLRTTETIGANPHYVAHGYVVVGLFPPVGPTNTVASGTLVAVPFDVRELKATGAAIPIAESVQVGPVSRTTKLGISRNGTIAFAPGSVGLHKLVEVGRDGRERDMGAESRFYSAPSLSPDGTRLAVTVIESAIGSDIWVYDRVAKGGLTRLTFDKSASRPIWTPDGRRIVYQRNGNMQDLAWVAADGSAPAETLTVGDDDQVPGAFTPDGRTLVVREGGQKGVRFISVFSLDSASATRTPVIATAFDNHSPALSPNGEWIAYASNETNAYQIYVRPFPGPGGKWQISRDGGTEPRWSRAGNEIFFRSGDTMMSVSVSAGTTFTHGEPQALFSIPLTQASPNYVNYDVTRDGKFILVRSQQSNTPVGAVVLLNWFENQPARSR